MDDEQVLPVWQLSEGELLGGLLASESALRRQYARTLELIAEAESRGVAVSQGYRDTATLLAMALRISRSEAKARVAQATTPMRLATKALQAGDIGPEHVREIQKVLAQAPATLPVEDREQGESTLVELAVHANAAAVAKAGQQLVGYWNLPERAPTEDERSHSGPRREFRYQFGVDGRMRFTGLLDPEAAEQLTGLFQPLAKPNAGDTDGLPDPRTTVQRQGDALADIIDLAARADDLPVAGGERAVVTVTVPLAELERRAGAALLDSSGWTSIGDLRRWCCDAKVLPAVLGTQGEVLDLGRATRHGYPCPTPRTRPAGRRLCPPWVHAKPQVVPHSSRGALDRRGAVRFRQYGARLPSPPPRVAPQRLDRPHQTRHPGVHPTRMDGPRTEIHPQHRTRWQLAAIDAFRITLCGAA